MARSFGRDPRVGKNYTVAERHNGVTEAHPTIPGITKAGVHPTIAEKGSIARRADPVIVDDECMTCDLPLAQHGGDRLPPAKK